MFDRFPILLCGNQIQITQWTGQSNKEAGLIGRIGSGTYCAELGKPKKAHKYLQDALKCVFACSIVC